MTETHSPHSALNPDKLPRPFSIGLSAIEPAEWIIPDRFLAEQVKAKQTLFADSHEAVFRAEADTLTAQAEVLAMLVDYLPKAWPDIYHRDGDTITIVPAGLSYSLSDYPDRPLELACRLVQDDLVIMRKGDGGYRIAAAAVCFPSTWVLADKFGKPISEVHGPVPGFGPGTRTAAMIDRIFENLKVGQPVGRCNWSIYEVPDLHHPFSHSTHRRWVEAEDGFFSGTWLRAERQTLTRLPDSQDVLFTIQIVVDPVSMLMNHPDRSAIAQKLQEHIESLGPEELDYKGIREHRELVLSELNTLVET